MKRRIRLLAQIAAAKSARNYRAVGDAVKKLNKLNRGVQHRNRPMWQIPTWQPK